MKAQKRKFKDDLQATVATDEIPDDIYLEMVRHHLNLSIAEWNRHSEEQRGKMAATQRVISDIEYIERAWEILKKNAEKEAKRHGKKGSNSKVDE